MQGIPRAGSSVFPHSRRLGVSVRSLIEYNAKITSISRIPNWAFKTKHFEADFYYILHDHVHFHDMTMYTFMT